MTVQKNIFTKKEQELFADIKESFLDYDPAHFTKNKLRIDRLPFNVIDNGWKFMADIYRHIALESIKKTGKSVVICKGRQIGGTMMAGALDLYFTNSSLYTFPPIRVAHLFPAIKLAQRFSQDKLEEIIRDSKDDFINKNKLKSATAVDNQSIKQFNGGTLFVESIGADGDRVRGMTADVAFFDEVQDMNPVAIGNTVKILTAAKYGPTGDGVQVYFGTPKERNSYFHTIWEMSDKRYYHLGCKSCDQLYPFYQSGNDSWQTIWQEGFTVKCPFCGALSLKIDAVQAGAWVPSVKGDTKFVGFHVNQLYHPQFTKEYITAQRPENNPTKTDRQWNNEVIGEFYSGAGLTITKSEIFEKCMDTDRAFSRTIDPKLKKTYLGMDWGEKVDNDTVDRGQSYSCAVVLSEDGNGNLLIEHAHKLKGNTFLHKKEVVLELMKRFGIRQAVADFFYGGDILKELNLIYRTRFLPAQGSGNLIKPLKYREEERIIGYNKDLLIEEVFALLRKGKIRFPGKSYEHLEWLIDHCTSMEVSSRTHAGESIRTYKKGAIPNDGLMAIMYAYIAYKFDMTKGFTFDPILDKNKGVMPRPALAYSPKLR